MGMEKRTFYAPDVDLQALAQGLHDWFAGQGHQTQILQQGGGGFAVQARKESTLRTIAGMSQALTATLTFEGDNIAVEMGGAKWMDKGVVAGVGVIVFFPALITAGIGAFQQSQLQSQAWQFIERFVRGNSAYGGNMMGIAQQAPPPAQFGAAQPAQLPRPQAASGSPPPLNLGQAGAAAPSGGAGCPQCGQALRPGAKFCDGCGAPAARNCHGCGQPLRPGARFCDGCGSPAAG